MTFFDVGSLHPFVERIPSPSERKLKAPGVTKKVRHYKKKVLKIDDRFFKKLSPLLLFSNTESFREEPFKKEKIARGQFFFFYFWPSLFDVEICKF